MSESESSAVRRNVLAGTVARVLEWYDFARLGYNLSLGIFEGTAPLNRDISGRAIGG